MHRVNKSLWFCVSLKSSLRAHKLRALRLQCRTHTLLSPINHPHSPTPHPLQCTYELSGSNTEHTLLSSIKAHFHSPTPLHPPPRALRVVLVFFMLHSQALHFISPLALSLSPPLSLSLSLSPSGIRRKRMKGDTWDFKNVCGEIFRLIHI